MEENTQNDTVTTETPVVSPLVEAVSTGHALYDAYTADVEKFRSKGTASAVGRARKAASALAKHIKVIRKELQLEKVKVTAIKRAAKAAKKAASTETPVA